jgi:hypothetical protein
LLNFVFFDQHTIAQQFGCHALWMDDFDVIAHLNTSHIITVNAMISIVASNTINRFFLIITPVA